jgi:hypothetical protein
MYRQPEAIMIYFLSLSCHAFNGNGKESTYKRMMNNDGYCAVDDE